MSTTHLLIFVGVTLAGLLQVALALWLRGKTRALQARGARAAGRVVGAEVLASGSGGSTRHDVIAYQAADGREYTVTSRIGVPWSTYAGRAITVLYDPAAPDDAVIEHWVELWAAAGVFLINGVLMALGGAAFLVLLRLGLVSL